MKEMARKCRYLGLILWLSTKWMFKVNLGDLVTYRGQRYRVANGVRCESWRLSDLENGDNGWVKRSDCRKVVSVRNALGSFRFRYRFYMLNWFDIWVHVGIKPYMRQCRIW